MDASPDEADREPMALAYAPADPAGWRERLGALGEAAGGITGGIEITPLRLVAAVVLVAALCMGGYVLLRSPPAADVSLPVATTSTNAEGTDGSGSAGATGDATTSTAGVIVVAASGAVVAPGVYRLPPGSRVTDLLTAAGGLAAGADGDRINLAAPLQDGQWLYVPRVGQPVPSEVTPSGGGAAGSDGEPQEPVDLNTATVDDLDQLPGIGPATAEAIVAYRQERGPFRSVDDLLDVRGIGDAKLAELRPLVRV
jgi:competence protein ComEA